MNECNMTLDEFEKFAFRNDFYGEYLVKLRYKHDYETEYAESSQIVTIDFYGFDKFLWLYDWNEGETDVIVLGYIKISEMEETIEKYKKVNQELKEGLEKAIEMIRTQDMLKSLSTSYIPEPCRNCASHPSNGGDGICHCTLGTNIVY